MNEEYAKKLQQENRLKEPSPIYSAQYAEKVIIPICCREGWASCPHQVKKDKVNNKKNIGL